MIMKIRNNSYHMHNIDNMGFQQSVTGIVVTARGVQIGYM